MPKQTPMLTLNQKLPGEQPIFKKTKQHRQYRTGEVPQWLKEEEYMNVEKSDNKPQILREKISPQKSRANLRRTNGKDRKWKRTDRRDGKVLNREEMEKTDSDTEDELTNFGNLDLDNLKVARLPSSKKKVGDQNSKKSGRAALKEALLKKEKMRKEIISKNEKVQNTKSNKIDEKSSEYEDSDSSSELDEQNELAWRRLEADKPRFISSKRRGGQRTHETTNELALQLRATSAENEEEEKLRRRTESVRLVVALSRAEKEAEKKERDSELAELPDDRDDVDEEAQFELWKLRELKRVKEDVEKRLQFEEEQELVRRRRAMTEEEREKDNRKSGSKRYEKKQEKIQYLQKYHHKGAFYQDDRLITKKLMERNFMDPVGEDKYTNRLLLPDVMQVKNFGLASRTK
ncbi:hypothetical protein MHBO_003057, partial [Bonamia ostreae]